MVRRSGQILMFMVRANTVSVRQAYLVSSDIRDKVQTKKVYLWLFALDVVSEVRLTLTCKSQNKIHLYMRRLMRKNIVATVGKIYNQNALNVAGQDL